MKAGLSAPSSKPSGSGQNKADQGAPVRRICVVPDEHCYPGVGEGQGGNGTRLMVRSLGGDPDLGSDHESLMWEIASKNPRFSGEKELCAIRYASRAASAAQFPVEIDRHYGEAC